MASAGEKTRSPSEDRRARGKCELSRARAVPEGRAGEANPIPFLNQQLPALITTGFAAIRRPAPDLAALRQWWPFQRGTTFWVGHVGIVNFDSALRKSD